MSGSGAERRDLAYGACGATPTCSISWPMPAT
jgi:hypothetical protein